MRGNCTTEDEPGIADYDMLDQPKQSLDAIYEFREHVKVGVLMSYGSSLVEASPRVAASVEKILKGAGPADLPIERLHFAEPVASPM
jgi:hypothetical protein